MNNNDYSERKPQREFMANIAKDINKVDWMLLQVGDEQACADVFLKSYTESIMSRLLTLSQEQAINVLFNVIEAQQIAPLFKDQPETVMGRILEFDSCQFDF